MDVWGLGFGFGIEIESCGDGGWRLEVGGLKENFGS